MQFRMKLEKETQEKIQELQILEQSLQQLLLQKQAFQLELNETESALSETEKTHDDIYRIVGSIMIKTAKSEVEKELKEKKDIINLRLKSIDKQESSLREKTDSLRGELMKLMEQKN
jgi:prefoldin beta subunit